MTKIIFIVTLPNLKKVTINFKASGNLISQYLIQQKEIPKQIYIYYVLFD